MLTPLEVETKEFKKTMRGYCNQEVDSFLHDLGADYEKLHRDNVELKTKLEYMTKQIDSYKNLENSIKDTLIVAQKAAEDIHVNAAKESSLIVDEAKINAKNIINLANNEVIKMQTEYEEIRTEFILFKNKMKTLMGDMSLKSNILDKKFEGTQRMPAITDDMIKQRKEDKGIIQELRMGIDTK